MGRKPTGRPTGRPKGSKNQYRLYGRVKDYRTYTLKLVDEEGAWYLSGVVADKNRFIENAREFTFEQASFLQSLVGGYLQDVRVKEKP